jgi:quinol monooxygenase YgiN
MKRLIGLLSVVLTASLPFMECARAEDSYVVTYFETAPSAGGQAVSWLRALGRASREEEGNTRFEAFQRLGQPDHFALVEAWKDPEARERHLAAAHTRAFRERVDQVLRSAYDERAHTGLLAAPSTAAARASAASLYVLTHVDIVPTSKDMGIAMVRQLTEASRGDSGVLHFDALQQNSRQNHLTLVEAWKSRKAFQEHAVADHTRQFRQKLQPLSGSLYDERLYRIIR